MTSSTRDLLVVGEALIGLVPEGGVALRRSTSLKRLTVGAEVNVAVTASRLGHHVSWIGRVGNDLAGAAVIDDLRTEGVHVDHCIVDDHGPTGVLFRENVPLGAPKVSYARSPSAGSRLAPGDIPEKVVRSHRMVLVSGVTAGISASGWESANAVLELARTTGVTSVFDMNYRAALWSHKDARERLMTLAQKADIVFGGAEEWRVVFNTDEPSSALLPQASALIRTDGQGPLQAWVGDEVLLQPAFTTHPIDVVGAGDAFVGGTVSALLAGASWPVALRQGAYCGARSVSGLGDWTNLPWGVEGITAIPENDQEVIR